MGDYDCSEGFYGYDDVVDYGGYEYSHDQDMGRFEGYGFEGEHEVNEVPSSYDEVGAYEESYTSHLEPQIGVRYNPSLRKAYESHGESARVENEDSYSSPCSTFYQGRSGVNGYTSYSVGCPMRRRENTSPRSRGTHVPLGCPKLYNVDPRRSVHSGKVSIDGVPGCLLVLDDWRHKNYIMPPMVDYLGLFREPLLVPYSLDGYKVTERVRIVFTQFEYYEEVWCDIFPLTPGHVCLGADWFAQHRVPNVLNWPKVIVDHWGNYLFTSIIPKPQGDVITYSKPNDYERQKIERSKGVKGGNPRVEKGEVVWSEVRGLPPNHANYVCPFLSKDICVGTNMASGEAQGQREVAAEACGKPSHHGKEEFTQELQGF